MGDPVQTAKFVCKAERVQELTDTLPHMTRRSPFRVVKIIELTEAQYIHKGRHKPAFSGTPLFQAFSADTSDEAKENAA